MKLAERLRQKISQITIPLPEQDVQFTVSIGVAGLTPEMDGEALVEAADAAMYRAKKAGKNQVCGPEAAPGQRRSLDPSELKLRRVIRAGSRTAPLASFRQAGTSHARITSSTLMPALFRASTMGPRSHFSRRK